MNETDAWFTGQSDETESKLGYHDQAGHPSEANVGFGFERPFGNTVARGVVYSSGYLAIYSEWTHAVFLKFIADEILPHTHTDTEGEQQML